MKLGRIESGSCWSEYLILRLLRRWSAVRSTGENALPSLVRLMGELGGPAEGAIALHSLFQLTEECIGRALQAECCCSNSMAPDERAIMALIAAAHSNSSVFTTAAIPHGLPSALCWAAASARWALGIQLIEAGCIDRCPFERPIPPAF